MPPLPATDIDVSFADEIDALKDLDGAFMGAGEVRFGRWGFLTDIMFSLLSPGGTLPGGVALDVRTRTITVQEDVLFRAYQSEVVALDVGAGVRYWNLDNKLSIGPTIPFPGGVAVSVSEDWFDPVVAARAVVQLSGPWSLTLGGDIGGFDIGSQLTYQVLGTVNYQWNEHLALRAGYRLLSVDYENGDFLYDVKQYGPILAATYRF